MNCPYCENVIPPGAAKCPSCGAPAPVPPPQYAQQPYRPNNGPYAPPPQYGYRPQPAVSNAKNKMVFIILGIFLGEFGIHNFYAGYHVKGIIQLLITILSSGFLSIVSWIWAVIEVCTISVDSNNVPMK